MITIFDQQTGKLVTGTAQNISEFSFELAASDGSIIGVFDVSCLSCASSPTRSEKS
jgi:hypothetical protein